MKKLIISIIILSEMFFITGCSETNNSIIRAIESPNGKLVAVYFKRDMGATTRESYQLSILRHGVKLRNSGGNIYISYEKFQFFWEKDDLLIVKVSESDKAFLKLSKYRNVTIKYQ